MADDMLPEFIAESREHLDAAEGALLRLAKEGSDREALNRCFRAMHTIKGMAGFLLLDPIQVLTHASEQILSRLRDQHLPCSPRHCDLLLQVVSRIGSCLKLLESGQSLPEDVAGWMQEMSAQLGAGPATRHLLRSVLLGAPEVHEGALVPQGQADPGTTAPISTSPISGSDSGLPLHAAIAALAGVADLGDLTRALERIRTQGASGSWSDATAAALDQVFDFRDSLILGAGSLDGARDQLSRLVQACLATMASSGPGTAVGPGSAGSIASATALLDRARDLLTGEGLDSLGWGELARIFRSLAVEAAGAALDELEALCVGLEGECAGAATLQAPISWARRGLIVASLENMGRMLEGALEGGRGLVTPSPSLDTGTPVEPTSSDGGEPVTDRSVRTGGDTQSGSGALERTPAAEGLVRVSMARLNELVSAIGELLIAQGMVLYELGDQSPRLQQALDRQARIIRELQSLSLGLRMVPIRTTVLRLARAVHEVSRRLGKPVEFHSHGEDTEIDRTLVEALTAPLLHMVRNAIDHGIEDGPERLRLGKPEVGTVILSASHAGDHVRIRLSDDGRGLDPQRLRAKAIEAGIIPPDRTLDRDEAFDLIFRPGFSTAASVTDLSGRGVGMDVVRRSLEQIQGTIAIQSEVGVGTTFTISLPLTTAILDALLLRLGDRRFLIPATSVIEVIRPGPGDAAMTSLGQTSIAVRDRILPVMDLHDLLGIVDDAGDGRDPGGTRDQPGRVILVVEHFNGDYGLRIDEVLSQQQVVIKPLTPHLRRHAGLAGTAILNDGRVGLILNPELLLGAVSAA